MCPLKLGGIRLQSSLNDVFTLNKKLDSGAYSPSFVEKAQLIRDTCNYTARKNQEIKIDIYYISKAEFTNLSDSFNNKKEQVKEILNVNSIQNDFHLIGAKELMELSRKKEDYVANLMFDQITNRKQGEGYIGFVSLKEYCKCITDNNGDIREHIFEENVRDHLKTEVNNEIMKTLEDDRLRKNFWCLNNGVTIIATDVTPNGNCLNIKNIQIVNGLQTSYQIYNAKKRGSLLKMMIFLL